MSEGLDKIMNENGAQEEWDAFLTDTMRAKFDAELRLELEESLTTDFQFSKKNKLPDQRKEKRIRRIYYALAAAASFLLIILALNIFSSAPGNAQELASAYLTESKIYHSGASKGSGDNEETRMQAIGAFNAGAYTQAEQYFARLEDKTGEDIFYSAVASLFIQKNEEAIAGLELVAKSGTTFATEAKWYLAIAFILQRDESKAREVLLTIEDSTWNHEKIQALLKAIK